MTMHDSYHISRWFRDHIGADGSRVAISFLTDYGVPLASATQLSAWHQAEGDPVADEVGPHLASVCAAILEASRCGESKLSAMTILSLAVGVLEFSRCSQDARMIDYYYACSCYVILRAMPLIAEFELLALLSSYMYNHVLVSRKIPVIPFRLVSLAATAQMARRESRIVLDEIRHERMSNEILSDKSQHGLLFMIHGSIDSRVEYQALLSVLCSEGYVHDLCDVLFRHVYPFGGF